MNLQQTIGNQAVLQLIQAQAENSKGKAELGEAGLYDPILSSLMPPPIVQDVLQSPGQPLGAEIRAFMEQRLGQDFGEVRIHADARAADLANGLGSDAFTSGSDVVFNAGKYQPHSLEGRFLLAHELAHVAQQSGQASSAGLEGAESPGLEHEASDAAARILFGRSAQVAASPSAPAIQRFKISSGGFGQTLERVTNLWSIPDSIPKLMMKSPTFMAMVATLDTRYISIDEAMGYGFPVFVSQKGYEQLDPSGKISATTPAAKGKRVLQIVLNLAGAEFVPAWNPDNSRCGDVIEVTAKTNEIFIQELIHESTHATRFVTGANPAAATMADEINVVIQDEIAARTSEERALKEIPDPAVQARAATVGSKVPRNVQRDMAPAMGLTYLENIYFSRKLREQQKAEGIPDAEAEEIARTVSQSPDSGIFWRRSLSSGLSDFAYLCYKRARVIKDWKNFFANNKLTDADFAQNKEKVLQAHVKDWMNNEVSYLP